LILLKVLFKLCDDITALKDGWFRAHLPLAILLFHQTDQILGALDRLHMILVALLVIFISLTQLIVTVIQVNKQFSQQLMEFRLFAILIKCALFGHFLSNSCQSFQWYFLRLPKTKALSRLLNNFLNNHLELISFFVRQDRCQGSFKILIQVK
jgi:hypothetical protein